MNWWREICVCFVLVGISIAPVDSCFAADKKEAKGDAKGAAGKDAATAPVVVPGVRCESSVYYSWKPLPPTPNQFAQPSEHPEADKEPIEQFFKRAFATGADQEEVKKELALQVEPLLSEARRGCELERQSKGECVTRQIGLLGSAFHQMDFETRRLIREETIKDCQKKQGTCVAVRSSDAVCVVVVPDTLPESTAAAPTAAKDGKKK